MDGLKACSKCSTVKSLDEFHVHSKNKTDGRKTYCKACASAAGKQRYEAKKDHINAVAGLWKANNKDKVREWAKRYSEKNRVVIGEKYKAWAALNKDLVRARWTRRDARVRGAEGNFTASDIDDLMERQRGKCVVCKDDISKKYHIDHIYPVSKGGSNYPSNLQLLCPPCNRSKCVPSL